MILVWWPAKTLKEKRYGQISRCLTGKLAPGEDNLLEDVCLENVWYENHLG